MVQANETNQPEENCKVCMKMYSYRAQDIFRPVTSCIKRM